ncbi:hypothetical protein Tco_0319110 [Tanacetum coccineum]
MILESVENGPLIWPSIEENRVTRPKRYSELSPIEAIQADCDIKETNIILQGLPPEVYAKVSIHKVAKLLWERIQLLMQGTSLTKQERGCKLYDEFDKFAYKKGETLRDFYLRFSLLLNDMNIYNMKLEQFQVNTKFLNTLPPEWIKFVTDIKLVWDLHTTNVDQLHAYLGQHDYHANEVRLMHARNSDPLALVATQQMTQSPYQNHQNLFQNTQFQPQVSSFQSPQAISNNDSVNVRECQTCLKLETKLQTDFVEKETYDKLENSVSNQSVPSFDQLFELNELKAQSQEKDTVIKKLKERIKSLSGKIDKDKIKQDFEEIETINIELDHRSSGKSFSNYTSQWRIKETQRKSLVDNNVSNHPSDPELHQVNVEIITPKLLNKRTTHSAYIKHSQEEAVVLRDLVDHIKDDYPLDLLLESALGNACPLTRITTTTEVPLRKPITLDNDTPKPTATLVYSRKPRKSKTNVPVSNPKILQSVVQIVLWYLDSGCSKHMTGDRSQLTNFVSKFLGTVKFGNDHVAKIMGYGDYQIGNVTISRVYYVEGLGHNLFSMGQFCDSNLEVAFRQHTCYIRNLEGVDLLTGS